MAPPGPKQPLYHYRIRVEGCLGTSLSDWFAGLTITHTPGGETLLAGPVEDQAALHGLLARIRDLNLTLVGLERIEASLAE